MEVYIRLGSIFMSMLFLSGEEERRWVDLARRAFDGDLSLPIPRDTVRPNLQAAFHFYIGTLHLTRGEEALGAEWLEAGTLIEEDGLFMSAFLLGFLGRHGGQFAAPARAFEDPRHFIHFAGVPIMQGARERFICQAAHTLPVFREDLHIMDIGCGNGDLTVRLLSHLQETGKAAGIGEVLLIDPSPAMLLLAERMVDKAFPDATVTPLLGDFQQVSGTIEHRYDVAMSSLAYHHMPCEEKARHLMTLEPLIDHFLLFELNANNDTPEVGSPALSLSVYQSYGRIIDFVLSHDAPFDVAAGCVDCFLMTELISLMTEPRTIRTEYHMLRNQWNDLFRDALGPGFTRLCDSACYADEYVELFTIHYGRAK
jgi:SAM-dependent methyltransferase